MPSTPCLFMCMRYFVWAVAALVMGPACRESSPSSKSSHRQVPADFWAFYRRFHTDSLFQMKHISWPLPGQSTEASPEGGLRIKPVYWEKEHWRLQRLVDFDSGEFQQELRAIEGRYVVEIISYAKAPQYGLERRFMRLEDDSWELVYYADMHER